MRIFYLLIGSYKVTIQASSPADLACKILDHAASAAAEARRKGVASPGLIRLNASRREGWQRAGQVRIDAEGDRIDELAANAWLISAGTAEYCTTGL